MVEKRLHLSGQNKGFYIGRGGYRNFSGAMKFGKKGNRTFTIILNEFLATEVERLGWYVRWKEPRNEEEGPYALLDVTIRYDNYPPESIILVSDGREVELNEDNIDNLDVTDFDDEKTDIVLRPYNWNVNGQAGVKAYLAKLKVFQKVQEVDSF